MMQSLLYLHLDGVMGGVWEEALSAAASAIASGQAIPVSWRTDIADAGRGLEMAVSGPSHEWDKKDT